jgi:hypothetical protein
VSSQSNDCLETIHLKNKKYSKLPMSKQVECFFWFLSKIEFVFYLFTSRAI